MLDVLLIFGVCFVILGFRGWRGPIPAGLAVAAYLLVGLVWAIAGEASLAGGAGMDHALGGMGYGLLAAALVTGFILLFPSPPPKPRYSRDPARAAIYGLAAALSLLLGLAGIAAGAAVGGGVSFSSIMMVGLCGLCFHQAQRALAPSLETVLSRDPRPPILFLRSFAADEALVRRNIMLPPGFRAQRFEEWFASEIEIRIGPFVGLGAPDEHLPQLGAAKAYATHDTWRDTVRGLVEKSAAILVLAATPVTAGIAEELQFLRAGFDPRRVFLVTPPAAFDNADRHVAAFAESLAERFKLGMTPVPGQLIAFDEDWTPIVLGDELQQAAQYATRLKASLTGLEAKAPPQALPALGPS
jgi:hypothetical protein